MRLEGKTALVTGASRGIGRAIALAFAREGADVAITARQVGSLEQVADEVAALGRRVHALEWDVSQVSDAEPKLRAIHRELGALDIVVNNAGVVRGDESGFPDLTEAEWDLIMGVNLKGLYFVCQATAKLMTEQGSGLIINIASDAGLRPEVSAYGLSKWGVIGLTKGLAKRLASAGVRVNAIAPGPVATQMMRWEPGDPLESPSLPLGRLALPEEVAAAAVFLASEESAAVVGDILVLNSGG